MSEQSQPNVAMSLLIVHKVITRAIDVAIDSTQTYSQEGFPNENLRSGFVNYINALISLLSSHHLTEDEHAFPDLKVKLPAAPYPLLAEQHQAMLPLLDGIRIAVAADGALDLGALANYLGQLTALWHAHIPIEEEHFSIESVGPLFSPDEHLAMIKRYGEFSQQHSGPGYLVLPFILFNLPPDLRAVMARGMPPEVVNHLVPVVWKEQWASMMPFLLE